MIEVETIFDNTTLGTNWYGAEELSTANNIKRVIFDVESVDIISQPNKLACLEEVRLNCVLPIDSSLPTIGTFRQPMVYLKEIISST